MYGNDWLPYHIPTDTNSSHSSRWRSMPCVNQMLASSTHKRERDANETKEKEEHKNRIK
jgi:hypothetical protein